MSTTSFYLVFGLTADPPHKGHEQVVINSYQFMMNLSLSVEQFDLIPTFEPNLIAGKKPPTASFDQRFLMCQHIADDLNTKLNYNVQVNNIEQQLAKATGHKSYSYQTLKSIKHPNKIFVVSADHFAGRWPKFRKWHQWQNLIVENGLLIHQRPGHNINVGFINELQSINPNVFVVDNLPEVPVSSTKIRNYLAHKRPLPDNFLHGNVLAEIKAQSIY